MCSRVHTRPSPHHTQTSTLGSGRGAGGRSADAPATMEKSCNGPGADAVAVATVTTANTGTAGAFARPSRVSRDYDLVAELAQEIRTRGRPVTWEEMNFPDLATEIDRPVKPCPGGRTPSRGSLGTPSSLGSTVPYSGGSS